MTIYIRIQRYLHRVRPRACFASVLISLLSILLLLGMMNLCWRARSGSEELASSVHTLSLATIGTLIDMRTPAESSPDRQYEFWQDEVNRILDMHPDDAGLFAAGALLFDEPCLLYTSDVFKDIAKENGHAILFPNEVVERIQELRAEYDRRGSARSTELIRQATQLDPDGTDWWRLRAVLLWPPPMSGDELEPRDTNWQQVLRDAERHDPGNALYTVVAGYGNAQSALGMDEDANFVVEDRDSWIRTIELAKKCVTYQKLTLGEPGVTDLARLHSLSRHPRATTIDSIRHRFVGYRCAYLTIGLARHLMRMAEVKELASDYDEREQLLQLSQEVINLAHERSDSLTRYQTITYQMRRIILEVRADFERERGEVSEQTESALEDAAWWEDTVISAASTVNQGQPTHAGTVLAAVSTISLPLFATTLVVAIVLMLLCFFCGRPSPDGSGALLTFALHFLGIGLTALFLGAGPAGLVSEPLQHWILTGLSFVVVWTLIAGIASHLITRFRFTIRSLMIVTGVVAFLLQVLVHFQVGWDAFGLPIQVHASSNKLLGIVETQQPNLFDHWLPGPSWISRLLLQWVMHHGPSWSVAVFLIMIATRLVWSLDFTDLVRRLLIPVIALTLIWLNVWIWVEPANYVTARPAQMRLETYVRSVEEYYHPIDKLVEAKLENKGKGTGASQ